MDASPASTRLREFVSFQVDLTQRKQFDSLRILIVDNDHRGAAQVQHQLLSHRAELDDQIKCVRHGLDALVVGEEFQPELIIMQLGLPRRSGACTAKLLRARPWADQVIIVSHSPGDQASGATTHDFDFHFYHGIDIPLLMQIHKNLRIRRLGSAKATR